MKIFITGANGSIGTEILKILSLDSANHIYALAYNSTDTNNLRKFQGINIAYGNITDINGSEIASILAEIDVCIHLAALVHNQKVCSDDHMNINFKATKNIADYFYKNSKSRIKQFIFISTVSVFGNYKKIEYNEEDKCIPDTPYGESKLFAENSLIELALENNCKYTIVRPVTVYGGNDKGNIGKMINFMKKYHFFPIFGSGNNKKSFVHVSDVASAIVKTINNNNAFNEIFIIGGPVYTMNTIIQSIKEGLNITAFTPIIPSLLIRNFPLLKKITQNNIYSYEKAVRILEYKPLSIEVGLLKER